MFIFGDVEQCFFFADCDNTLKFRFLLTDKLSLSAKYFDDMLNDIKIKQLKCWLV
jgi:hypothetical protein